MKSREAMVALLEKAVATYARNTTKVNAQLLRATFHARRLMLRMPVEPFAVQHRQQRRQQQEDVHEGQPGRDEL